MTTDWWLSKSADRLRAQVDRRWPDRDHASDGTIGDPAHASRDSDHNPDPDSDPPNVVRALDIDADLGPPGAMQRFTNQLAVSARKRRDRSRLAYIIYNRRIAQASSNWLWRTYDGDDPHTNHAHVSFTAAGDHDGRRFNLPIFREPGRLRRRIAALTARITQLLGARRRATRRLDRIT